MSEPDRRAAAPAVAVVAAAIVLWLVGGAGAWEVLRYLGYLVVLVIAPGWLLLAALAPGIRSKLTRLALAWPLGLLIELAAFTLTAALDIRDLLPVLQLAVAAAAAGLVWRRRAGTAGGGGDRGGSARSPLAPLGPGPSWVLSAVIVATFAYIALLLFAPTPLPGTVESVRYPTDVNFHLSVAADLKHHTFPSTPEVAGVPLRYHYFVYVHNAAASQVTGVELPVVALRFTPLALALLVLTGIATLARLFTGRAWCAAIGAALFLIASELDLKPEDPFPFLGVRDNWTWLSPTYMLGVAAFVAALVAAGALLDRRVERRLGAGGPAAWVLVTAMLLLGSGAKSVVVPTLVAGLGAYAALRWLRERRLDRTALALVGLSACVFVATYALLYLDGGDGGLELGFGKIYERAGPLFLFEPDVPDFLPAEVAYWGLGSLAASALLFGSLALPLGWRLAPGASPLGEGGRLLLCILVPGLAAWLLLSTENADNAYFTALALIAVMPLAAEGLERAFGSLGELRSRRGLLILAQMLAAVLLLALAGWALARDGQTKVAYAVGYGPLALAAAGAVVWLLRRPQGSRAAPAAAITLVVMGIAALNPLLDSAAEDTRRLVEGDSLYDASGAPVGIGRDEVAAAEWARDNLPGDAVLATATDTERGAPPPFLPIRTDIPAIAERRVLFEGWAYSTRSQDWTATVFGVVVPYEDRRELQRRAIFGADPGALREIADRFDVSHLLLPLDDPRIPESVRSAGEVVYESDGFQIVELPEAPET